MILSILLISTWETGTQYRQVASTTNPMQNLALMVQEMNIRDARKLREFIGME